MNLRPLAAAAALLLLFPMLGHAQIWNHTAPDGTVEFTNRKPAGSGWHKSGPSAAAPKAKTQGGNNAATGAGAGVAAGAEAGPSGAAPSEARASQPPGGGAVGSSIGGTFWSRAREGGVVEFTNVPPIGSRWKVWLRTGPGKAAALRGHTDVVPPRDGSPSRFSRYDQHIQDQQSFFGIPEALLRAVIKTESDFDPNVISSAGAKGLMQLMPDTARLMGVTDVFDPRQNIMGGARYLQVLARRFCKTPAQSAESEGGERTQVCSYDEKVKIIAGYHAGPAAVEKYGGLPPYETTRAYVTAVMRRYDRYRQSAAGGDQMMAER